MVKMVNMVHLSDYSHLQVRLGFFGCERWAVEGNINGVNTEVTLAKTKEARTLMILRIYLPRGRWVSFLTT